MKIPKYIRFVGNLILSTRCELYFDDVTVASFVNRHFMAALPLKVSRNEQRSVICFRWARGRSANAMRSEMRPVCGDECYTRPTVHVWCKEFARGHESVADEERLVAVLFWRPLQSQQPICLVRSDSVANVFVHGVAVSADLY